MRVVIVDDEELARMLLREYLAQHADIEIVAECANGFEAVKAIVECEPDLVFLDIQMPKLNGFEVVELAGPRTRTRYVFVTAYDQYALKAFEVHAVDYLLKPFSQQRFDAALAHVRGSGVVVTTAATVTASASSIQAVLAEPALRPQPLERILIRDGGRVHVVAVASIAFIEAQDDYVRICAGGKSYLKNQRLSELEAQLDARSFARVHRSYLVNLACIRQIEQGRDSHAAILQDGARIPVSRSGYQKVRHLLGRPGLG